MSTVTALKGYYQKQGANVLLLDAGDFSQGTNLVNYYKGLDAIYFMNAAGYDAASLGNHEFDFGLENMAELFRMADFPVVCSNYDVTGTLLEGLVKPYITLEIMTLISDLMH